MRVCILVESFAPRVGGTPTQARLLAEDLAAAGHEAIVVTRRWDNSHPAEERLGVTRVIRLGPVGMGAWKKWGLALRAVPALKRLNGVDAIFCPGVRVLGAVAVHVARRKGWRCVLRPVSCGEMSGAFFAEGLKRAGLRPGSWPVRLFLKARNAVLRKANAFVAISGEIADELRAAGVAAEKIVRIPNGVDESVFAPAAPDEKRRLRAELGLRPDWQVAVYTGRLVAAKGLPGLLRVWSRVAAEAPAAHLLLVGGGGNDMGNCEAELKRAAVSHGLAGRVTFTGDVQGVAPYLRASDVFVFPTLNEAFGISLIEAMACGLPAVSTDAGGVKDIVADGENALVYAPGDEPGLESALRRVLGDAALAARLGVGGLRTVQARYTRGRVAAAYERVLRGDWES